MMVVEGVQGKCGSQQRLNWNVGIERVGLDGLTAGFAGA